MTSSANLTIVIDAINQSTRQLQGLRQDLVGIDAPAQKSGNALGKLQSIVKAGFALQGVQEGINFLKSSAEAAAEDAASTARLKQAVENTGSSYGVYEQQLQAVIKKGQNLGFTDDETRSGLAILTAQTGNASEAMKRYAIAQDLARGADIDVVTASRLLGKVTDDNVRVLARYGITVKQGATETELFAAIQQKFGGQAAAFAETAAGKWAIFVDKIHEAKESIGGFTLGPLTDTLTIITRIADQSSKLNGQGGNGSFFSHLAEGAKAAVFGLTEADIKILHLAATFGQGGTSAAAYAAHLKAIGESEAADVAPTLAFSGALSALEQHLAGLGPQLTDQAVTNRGLVNAQVESIRSTKEQADVTQQAYAYIATLTDATSKAITATHGQELADKAEAEAKRQQADADAAYALTLQGQVDLLYKDAAATQLSTQAKIEYNAELGLQSDAQGNVIKTFEQLVQDEKDSIVHQQLMTRVAAEANKELGIQTETVKADAAAWDGLSNSVTQAQYSVADYGTAALAPNFRPQDFQTIRGSPTVNGGGASGGGSSGGSSGGTSGGSVGGAQGGGSVAYYSSGYAAPRTTAVRQSVSSYSSRPASRSAASNVHNGTVINGNVYITTSANNFNGAFNRI